MDAVTSRESKPRTVVVTAACVGCGACLRTCPEHAIRPVGHERRDAVEPLLVRADLCSGCYECIEICPADAIVEATAESAWR